MKNKKALSKFLKDLLAIVYGAMVVILLSSIFARFQVMILTAHEHCL